MSLILIFLICEHEISFGFSWIFFTFFHQYLSIFTSLLKFIPKTVFVFDEFLNQVSLFIYFFSEVMVVCRNTTNFSVDLISCKFADYFFIRVNSNFGLLIMTILLFFFSQIWLHFISLYCLIAPARTSSTMVNKSDESRPLCLIPELR